MKDFLEFIELVLRDEHGINEASIEKLYELIDTNGLGADTEKLRKLLNLTEATDGRYYIS